MERSQINTLRKTQRGKKKHQRRVKTDEETAISFIQLHTLLKGSDTEQVKFYIKIRNYIKYLLEKYHSKITDSNYEDL